LTKTPERRLNDEIATQLTERADELFLEDLEIEGINVLTAKRS